MEEETKSKITQITNGSFKSYRLKKDTPEATEDKTEAPMEEIDEISYHSGSLEDREETQEEPFTPLPPDVEMKDEMDAEEPEGSIAPT